MPHTLIAGDIGGTNTRLQLCRVDDSGSKESLQTVFEKTYQSQDYPSLLDVLSLFISESKPETHPVVACIGIAGPVERNSCQVTNVPWPLIQGDELAKALNLKAVTLLNDFAANGYGLLALKSEDFVILNNVPRVEGAPKGIIGAGTGLGEAYLTCHKGAYEVWGTEGGHCTLTPRDDLELGLVNYLKERLNITHVSVERAVSGPGIAMIYDYLRSLNPSDPSPAESEIRSSDDPSALVSKYGVSGEDAVCQRAMDMFISFYGAEMGNFALKIMPMGGLYIAGGIAGKIKDRLLAKNDFMTNFFDKGRMRRILAEVPVYLVTKDQLGMAGAQVMAVRLLQKNL
eukprot:GILI01009173.1.p2 GENE.GILI01009173.1~~GILI01009173.1.p2  ORF type:complete len:343 (+),score=82.52 GILI01009173.1:90-1118(+)